MKKWEYRITYPDKVTEKELNEYGQDGCELVSCERINNRLKDSYFIWILKREIV